MSSKPVLAVDFDDTLANFAQGMAEAYNAEVKESGGETVTPQDFYIVWKVGVPAHGWNHDRVAADQWIAHYLFSDRALGTPPIDGSVEVIYRLKEKYDIHVVTGRDVEMRQATEQWIEKYFPGVFKGIHFEVLKAVACKQIDAVAIVDDAPPYIAATVSAGIRSICFGDYAWNDESQIPHGAEKARDWYEVERLLMGDEQ